MSAHRTALCLAAVFIITAGSAPVAAETEPLRGTVVNQSDTGLKDVRITLQNADGEIVAERITDDDGHFDLPMETLRPGQEIHLSKNGYVETILPVSPQQLVVANIRVVLEPDRGARPPRPTPTPPSAPPTLVTARQRERAVRLYNEGVELWEDHQDDRNRMNDALRLIREAASLDPDFPEPLKMLIGVSMSRQAWAEASRYSEALIRIEPNNVNAVRTLYFSMVVMRHHFRIGDAARRMVELEPDTISAVIEHADTFYSNENWRMAKALYEILAEISTKPEEAYLNLGSCCIQLEDVACTKSAFEAFVEIAPADHPYRETVINDLAIINQGNVVE